MKNQNKIFRLLLGVALIAELVCFAPDIEAQYNSPIVAWKDTCPICDMKAISWCKCLINERTCENQHTWYWWNNEKIIGSKHNNTNSIDYLRAMWKEIDSLKQQLKKYKEANFPNLKVRAAKSL